jgi:hypothetical protein
MSETALRATPAVNIDEFERRLRATGSLIAQQEDPLAELARLLGAEEPPATPAAPAVEAPKPRTEAAASPRQAALGAEGAPRRVANVDFGSEAAVSGSKPPPIPDQAPEFEIEASSDDGAEPHAPQLSELMSPTEETPRPRRKVWAMSVLVLIGAVGATGAWFYRGGAVPGLGSRTPPFIMAASGPTKVQPPSQDTVSSPNDVASLLGKEQPIKPAAATITSSQEQPVDLNERAKAQASAEAHAAAPPPSPPTIAAAPLVVVAAPSAGSTAAPSPSSSSAPAAPSGGAAAAPTPAPAVVADASATRSIAPAAPSNTATIAPSAGGGVGGTASASSGGSAAPTPPTPFPEPKRVKTISVRPDGSVIGAPSLDRADQKPIEPASEQPVNPPKPVVRPTIDASAPEAATPKLDLPAKPTKSTTRVPIAKIDTTAATATSQSPEAPTQLPNSQHDSSAKKHEAAAKVASAEPPPVVAAPVPAPQQSAPEPAQPKSFLSAIFGGNGQQDQPPASAAAEPSKPIKTATAEAAPASDAAGGYAVQLAAPGSEAEAQNMSNRLRTKYANELGGLELSVHKAVIKDKTVYRVRAGSGMAKAAAVSLCEKLRAAGGACFLARD